MPELAGWHEFPSGEDTIEQSVFFLDRNQNRSVDVEDDESEEHEHQEVMNQAKIRRLDEVGQPSDVLVQEWIPYHLAVEEQPSQDFDQNQQVDDEVR